MLTSGLGSQFNRTLMICVFPARPVVVLIICKVAVLLFTTKDPVTGTLMSALVNTCVFNLPAVTPFIALMI